MSQGGSRRPFSRGGPRWHPRYKEYWDYDQNYSDGSSGGTGSPKEACVQSPPPASSHHPHPPAPQHPPAPPHPHPHPHQNAKRDVRRMPPLTRQHHDQRRMSIGGGGGTGAPRRAERRAAVSDHRRTEMRLSPGAAGPSVEPSHVHHASHHHHMDTNPLEGPVESLVGGAASSDDSGEMSSKTGDSPSRKRRRISRHLSSGESNVSVAPPAVERRTPRHHYQPQHRMRYLGGGGAGAWHDPHSHQHAHPHPHPHPHPLLLDINQMSLRGARLGALGGGVGWHPHPHPHREHPQRTQVAPGEVWGVLPPLPLRYQMGGVYAGVQYGFNTRGFASPPHPHPHHPHPPPHPHYINSQRDSGRLDMVGGGEGGLSPLQELHHAPLLLAEARGTPIELMAPHHARHALSHHHHRRGMGPGGGGGAGGGAPGGAAGARGARPYVRHAPRWPHHAVHHLAQGGGGVVGGVAGVGGVPQLHVPLSLPVPPPTYQVFLNLLAMFPLSPYPEPLRGGDEAAEAETENYEALLSLAERLGEAKPRGLARHEIDQLPSYKYKHHAHSHTAGEQTSCVVCMCEFEARQTVRVLPCAHHFHAKCVDKWLRSNRTCPICRGNASDYFSPAE